MNKLLTLLISMSCILFTACSQTEPQYTTVVATTIVTTNTSSPEAILQLGIIIAVIIGVIVAIVLHNKNKK